MANKLRKGDEVIVLTGKDKGGKGTISKVITKDGKAIVDGVNMVKKHVRPNPNLNEAGGIKEMEAPIQLSNLAILNPTTKKADRVGFKVLENGRKVRVFKSNQEQIDV